MTKCSNCYKEITKKVFVFDETTSYCGPCYFKHVCSYCKTPVLTNDCPGHDVFQSKGNRFLDDRNFNSPVSLDDD